MAYPVLDSIVALTGASGSSFTPATLPAGYVNGDIIVFWVGQDGGSGTLSIATAGWSIHGTRTGTPAGAAFGSWFSTVVSGGTFNTPTFASSLSEDWAGIGFIVRGAPSSSWVDVVGTQTDWNTAGNAAAGTPTTGTDGCLVLHGWVSDGSVQFRPDITDANLIAQYIANSQVSIAVTYRQQETAGAVDAMQMYFNKATEGGTQFTLCIKNDTNAKLAPFNGKPVHLKVGKDGYTIEATTDAMVQAKLKERTGKPWISLPSTTAATLTDYDAMCPTLTAPIVSP